MQYLVSRTLKIIFHLWHPSVSADDGLRLNSSVLELQPGLWLCSPTLEWQSLLQFAQTNREGPGIGMRAAARSFLFCLFSCSKEVRLASAWRVPAATVCLQTLLSFAASSQLLRSMPACFMSRLQTSLKRRHRSTNRPGACRQLPIQDSSGEPTGVHPVDVTKPSEAALAQHGKHAGGVSKFQDFCVGYFLLPRDAQDAA